MEDFQVHEAAVGNALSPTVDSRVGGTICPSIWNELPADILLSDTKFLMFKFFDVMLRVALKERKTLIFSIAAFILLTGCLTSTVKV